MPIDDTRENPAQSYPSGNSHWASLLFSYKGRIGRLRYFIASLILAPLPAIIGFFSVIWFFTNLFNALSGPPQLMFENPYYFLVAPWLPIILGTLGISFVYSTLVVKRFHDLGKSGKWWFAMLVPIWNIHLAFGLLMERGTMGPNIYGEDPLPVVTPSTDVVHRISQNKFARAVLVVAVLCLAVITRLLSTQNGQQPPVPLGVLGNFVETAENASSSIVLQVYHPEPITLTTGTAGWLSYSSDQYKFSILYPQNFNAHYPSIRYDAPVHGQMLTLSTENGIGANLSISVDLPIPGTLPTQYDDLTNTSTLAYFAQMGTVETSTITFLGYPATEMFIDNGKGISEDYILFKTKSVGYEIRRSYFTGTPKYLSEDQAVDQMLATLKFSEGP